jgi:hypothetical protein
MREKIAAVAAFLALTLALTGCGKNQEPATEETALPTVVSQAEPDPNPPVEQQTEENRTSPASSWSENSGGVGTEPTQPTEELAEEETTPEEKPASTPVPTATPAPTATPLPTVAPTPEPTPEPTAPPLQAGTYEGSDGSVLTVEKDGTCTYETTLSGTVNGKAMSGKITFHGTVTDGVFSFTKVTYMGLDVTAVAKNSGYDDASYWEQAAAILYAGSF